MSLADFSLSRAPIAAQAQSAAASGKPPKNRQVVAQADVVEQPEAR